MQTQYFPLFQNISPPTCIFAGRLSFNGYFKLKAPCINSILLAFVFDGQGEYTHCGAVQAFAPQHLFLLKHGTAITLNKSCVNEIGLLAFDSAAVNGKMPDYSCEYCSNAQFAKQFKKIIYGNNMAGTTLPVDFIYTAIEVIKANDSCNTPAYLKGVLLYINKNYDKNITLDGLAEKAGVGKYKLLQDFKQHFKTTPIHYLNNKRLSESANLLQGTDLKIAEIGEIVGFSSPAYFTKCFVKHYGATPLAYRFSFKSTQTAP